MTGVPQSDPAIVIARDIALRPRPEWFDALAAVPETLRERVRAYLRGWEVAGAGLKGLTP